LFGWKLADIAREISASNAIVSNYLTEAKQAANIL
jgi:predicted transcriptional regulator